MMSNLYNDLLTQWCDSMLKLQNQDQQWPSLYGGIMCPSCSRIHGRCADAVYPLMYMAHTTGQEKYLDAAIKVVSWSDNVTCSDGSWINDSFNGWKGITVFGAIALGEAVIHHGNILDKKILDKWLSRLHKAGEFLYDFIDISTGNINYPVTCSAAMAILWKIFDEPKYLSRAKELAHQSFSFFTPQYLLFGEGRPQDSITPRGCRGIDLGYNVEESLPALVLYGLMTDDQEVLDVVEQALKTHLEFMLPDGAWDNSWGSRKFKWTYWGSRTSDGCQPAYLLMADRDPRFAEAAHRNTQLLQKCTHNGILYGGPHVHARGELPCIHHTFTHAKALAIVLDYCSAQTEPKKAITKERAITLPCEQTAGIKEFPEAGTWLIAKGPWRATVTGYDFKYSGQTPTSGGALTLLWHQQLGPLLSASLTEYVMLEPHNMQIHKDTDMMPLTPRIEFSSDNSCYTNINDTNAKIVCSEQKNRILLDVTGKLVDTQQCSPKENDISYTTQYNFAPDSISISITTGHTGHMQELLYYLPIISDHTEQYKLINDHCIEIAKGDKKLVLSSNTKIQIKKCDKSRAFNFVPGFEAIPIYFDIISSGNKELNIKITVCDNHITET